MHEWNAKRWTELSNLVSTKKRWKKVDLRTQTDNAALDRNEIEWNSNETLQCFRMFHTCFVKQWKTLDAGCTWGHGGTGIRNSEVEIFVLFVEVERWTHLNLNVWMDIMGNWKWKFCWSWTWKFLKISCNRRTEQPITEASKYVISFQEINNNDNQSDKWQSKWEEIFILKNVE